MIPPPLSTYQLTDLADQAERFMLMSYERQPTARVLYNDSWALALAGHAREIALRRMGASPDLEPLARTMALLTACRYWGQGGQLIGWEAVSQEFMHWTGPDYLGLHLMLRTVMPDGNGDLRAELEEVLHDAELAQRILAGTIGAELTWLENRYANGPGQDTAADRQEAIAGYLGNLRRARFRNGDLRRQYQHTHSAVLLDLQRLADKLTVKSRAAALTLPAAASPTGTHHFSRLGRLEEGPSRQAAQTFFRTVFRNHINLTAIADQKAAIMISVNTLLIGALITFTSYRNWAETRPDILLPISLFVVCGVVSLVYSVLAARPTGHRPEEENLAFFGSFSHLSRREYAEKMERRLRDPNALYGTLVNDLHGLGSSLQGKYRLLRLAYTIFLAGLVISGLLLAAIIVF